MTFNDSPKVTVKYDGIESDPEDPLVQTLFHTRTLSQRGKDICPMKHSLLMAVLNLNPNAGPTRY